MDQLIVHKPMGKVISDKMMEKIRKEYTNPEVFFCYKKEGDGWRYSDGFPKRIESAQFFEANFESFIIFDKGFHYQSKVNPVCFREQTDDNQWFVNSTIGQFSFLSGANDRCSKLLFETFLKFCDLNSAHSFLKNVCKRHFLKSFIVSASGVGKYGTWFTYEQCHYTSLDFANKLTYDAKTSLKNIIAFLSNPSQFRQEVLRLEKLTDYEIRMEAEKRPESKEILEQIG